MIYLDQASWDECHRLLKKQKQLLERLGRISERQEAGGQISTLATTNIRPKKIVNLAEKQRPPIFSVKIESLVGLEERVQVSEPKVNSENDSSEECSNDEQGRDINLAGKTTPIDMIIGDKADIEKSHSAKLFELKAKIGDIIMPRGHTNYSTHLAAESGKNFSKLKIFGENSLFGLERNQFENFDVIRSRLRIKHHWPPPDYGVATFISVC